MKRRSFLQMLAAATAALVAPKVVAKANVDYLTDPAKWVIKPVAAVEPVGCHHIFVSSTTARFGYGKGTFNYPFATIQEAVNVSNPGDVIVLKSSHIMGSGARLTGERDDVLRIVWSYNIR